MDDRDDSSVKLVVGLGNPGRQYARTRHNVGFRAVQAVARLWDCSSPRGAFGGKTYDARPMRGQDRSRRVVLLQPHTFMNCSGQAVKGMVSFYKADLDDLLVVLDDIALPLGALRMRAVGSAGGLSSTVSENTYTPSCDGVKSAFFSSAPSMVTSSSGPET